MARPTATRKTSGLALEVKDLKIKSETSAASEAGTPRPEDTRSPAGSHESKSHSGGSARLARRSSVQTSKDATPQSPALKSDQEDTVGGEISVKVEPGAAPKLSRSQSKKVASRPPPLYTHEPDALPDALQSFDILTDCAYSNKYIGTTDHALECDCSEEWGKCFHTDIIRSRAF